MPDTRAVQKAVYVAMDNLTITEQLTHGQLVAKLTSSPDVQETTRQFGHAEAHQLIGEAIDQGMRDVEWPLTMQVSIGLRNQGLPSPTRFQNKDKAAQFSLMILTYYAFRAIAPTKRVGVMDYNNLLGVLITQDCIKAVFKLSMPELRRRVEQALIDLERLGCIRFVRIFVPPTRPDFS